MTVTAVTSALWATQLTVPGKPEDQPGWLMRDKGSLYGLRESLQFITNTQSKQLKMVVAPSRRRGACLQQQQQLTGDRKPREENFCSKSPALYPKIHGPARD